MIGQAKSPAVVILGAGLTGLSAALHLQDRDIACEVLEKNSFAGGHAVTIEERGFRFDRTGHLLHLRDQTLKERVFEWLDGSVLEVRRKSLVYSHRRYTRYPFQANTHGLPPQVAYECLMGFLQAHYSTSTVEPKDFEQYCLRYFGEGISKHFMLPYNARLWGVAAREITTEWCQRFVPIPKLEDVIAGAVGLNDRELGYNSTFYYPATGIGALPEGMSRRVHSLSLGTQIRSIDLNHRRVHLADRVVEYSALISSIPLDVLGSLCSPIPDGVAAALRRLRCTSLVYFDVALRKPNPIDFHWIYVPEERLPFYRVGCYSAFSSLMAPPNHSSLYIEMASRNEHDVADQWPRVVDGLIEMGIIQSEGDILFSRQRTIPHAYVIYDHHYSEAIREIHPFFERHNVFSTGRYGGWNYSSMEDAVRFGRDAAMRSAQVLET